MAHLPIAVALDEENDERGIRIRTGTKPVARFAAPLLMLVLVFSIVFFMIPSSELRRSNLPHIFLVVVDDLG